jgi:hypothetical protein
MQKNNPSFFQEYCQYFPQKDQSVHNIDPRIHGHVEEISRFYLYANEGQDHASESRDLVRQGCQMVCFQTKNPNFG